MKGGATDRLLVSANVPKRSEGGIRIYRGPRGFGIQFRRNFPMKWRIDVLYAKALYIVIVLASLVAAAAAGYKWR